MQQRLLRPRRGVRASSPIPGSRSLDATLKGGEGIDTEGSLTRTERVSADDNNVEGNTRNRLRSMLAIRSSKRRTTTNNKSITSSVNNKDVENHHQGDASNCLGGSLKPGRSYHSRAKDTKGTGALNRDGLCKPNVPGLLDGKAVGRGCMEATLSALIKAVTTCALATSNVVLQQETSDSEQQGRKKLSTTTNTVTGRAEAPPILQSSKGVGSEEYRQSALALMRFFGHTSLLHLEGVIWIKMSGERVHCIAALSDKGLFLVSFRASWSVGGLLSGAQWKQRSSSQIVEIPLSAMLEVAVVSSLENLNTFASDEANWVSRPFRIMTKVASDDGPALEGGDGHESSRLAKAPVNGKINSKSNLTGKGERIVTLVGFESTSRLRHFLVVARESWAVRTAMMVGKPAVRLLSSTLGAAMKYLAGIHDVMTGPLRNQNSVQADVMEGLADELILDRALKLAFFLTGDVFVEIARWLEGHAATNVEEAISYGRVAEGMVSGAPEGRDRNGEDVRRRLVSEVRRFSATCAVLDSAFFHSLEVQERVHLVERPMPVSLPVVSELLVNIYSALRRRLMCYRLENYGNCSSRETNSVLPQISQVPLAAEGGWRGADRRKTEAEAGEIRSQSFENLSVSMGDWVVGAVSGMCEVIRLFNIENEHKGLVRNEVSVSLGKAFRIGIKPAASDALGILIMVTERTVSLIDDLDHAEKTRLQYELETQQRRGEEDAERALLAPDRSPTGQKKERKGTIFKLLRSRPPSSASVTRTNSPYPGSPDTRSSVEVDDAPSRRRLKTCISPKRTSTAHDGDPLQSGNRSGSMRKKGVSASVGRTVDAVWSLDDGDGVLDYDGDNEEGSGVSQGTGQNPQQEVRQEKDNVDDGGVLRRVWKPSLPTNSVARELRLNSSVLLYSYSNFLHRLVCGSYDLRTAFVHACEAELRNIGRGGGYLDVLVNLDNGTPRMVFRETARYLLEIMIECHL